MDVKVSYNGSVIAGHTGTTTILSASEVTVAQITDKGMIMKSQASIYYDVTLGSATSVQIRYYYLPAQSNDPTNAVWFEIPVKDTSTGILEDIPTELDSSSPSQSTNIRTVEDFPISACFGIKVTMQAVAANATLNNIYVVARDN